MKCLISLSLFVLTGCALTNPISDGVGASTETPDQVYDFAYSWDSFQHRTTTIWACRGVQSGQFVDDSYCAFKPKLDKVWPFKNIPGHWRP